MLGERLVIVRDQHSSAGRIKKIVLDRFRSADRSVAVAIAGESGSGKTGIAYCLLEILQADGVPCILLTQDDYFRLPPRSNHLARLSNPIRIGPGEVRLDLMAEHIRQIQENGNQPLVKPLVIFDENLIEEETLPPPGRCVIIAEGTYTSLLTPVDLRVFVERDYLQTRSGRHRRQRDTVDEFLEQVLEIEHREIAGHKHLADVVIQ